MRSETIAIRPAEASPPDWRYLFVRSGLFILAATVVVHAVFAARGDISIQTIYFHDQDMYLLGIVGTALVLLARAGSGAALVPLSRPARTAAITMASLVAYAGGHWLLGRYDVTRDEVFADLAAAYFRHGRIALPIPDGLGELARAAMPLCPTEWVARGYFASPYLPVNSLLRAAAGAIGDAALTGPALLAIGMGALWSCAQRIWPAQPQAWTVAIVVALSSAQLLANAMTAYAMTGYFALNALWLACFLRGRIAGHVAALLIGIAASGLHQVQFHVMFVAGFVLWLWRTDRRSLALLYAAACAAYVFGWFILYPAIIDPTIGTPAAQPETAVAARVLVRLGRLAEFEPLTSAARFIAWQNVLLVPLALAGLWRLKDAQGRPTILWACAISSALALATMVFQGHGYGYRYLHGVIPCLCLLAANGWLTLGERTPLPTRLLWGSVAVALSATIPFALWRSEAFVAPYEAAYRAIRAAPADIVLVDTRAGAYVEDVVRLDGKLRAPLALDLGNVPTDALRRLCTTRRVMLFAAPQARALGMYPSLYPLENDAVTAQRRAMLHRFGCDTPMPLG